MPLKMPINVYRRKSGNFAYTRASDEDVMYTRSSYQIGKVQTELIKGIFAELEAVTHFPKEVICGASRDMELIFARMIYSKILFDAGFGVTKIGRSINRTHATVINLLKKFDTDRKYQSGLEEMYQNLKNRLCTQSAV